MMRVTDDQLILGDDYAMYYKGEPFSGVLVDRREDGTLWSEVTYVRGLRHGPSRTLYPNGEVKLLRHYKMAYPHGWKEERDPDGRLRRKALFELGISVMEQEFDR